MQKIIYFSLLSVLSSFLSACGQQSAQQQPAVVESVEAELANLHRQRSAAFPEGITEIILPVRGDGARVEMALPYQGGLIPGIGDEVILESRVNNAWTRVGQARVFDVTDQHILLKRSHGDVSAATRARVLANPLHRCDLEAASPLDDRAIVPGVEFSEIPIRAIESCSNAASKYAATARYHFQLGRALDAHLQEGPAVAPYRYALELEPDYAAVLLALGGKYVNGEGVEKNEQLGLDLLRQAHISGLVRATYLLGQIFEQGINTQEPALDKAIDYYTAAAIAGDLPAQLRLASIYEQGETIAQNLEQSMDWYEQAASQGHLDSQIRIAQAYSSGEGRELDWAQSYQWWERVALQGEVTGQMAFAEIYESGKGLESPQLNKAMYWYRQAADQGNAMGQYHVGRMYALGLGVQEDIESARHWLMLARAQGILEADRWLEPEKVEVLAAAEQLASPVIENDDLSPERVEDDIEDLNRWHISTQGFMDAECKEELVEELLDMDLTIVPQSQPADVIMIITMNNPEYYSGSMGPFRFTGFNVHYRAEVIRKQDNIRIFYTHGEEDGDDRSESCIDAVDEIIDELDDELY